MKLVRLITLAFAFILGVTLAAAQTADTKAVAGQKTDPQPTFKSDSAAPSEHGLIAWIDLKADTPLPTLLIKQDLTGLSKDGIVLNIVVHSKDQTSQRALNGFIADGYKMADDSLVAAFKERYRTDMEFRIETAGKILKTQPLAVTFVQRTQDAKKMTGEAPKNAPGAIAKNDSTQ